MRPYFKISMLACLCLLRCYGFSQTLDYRYIKAREYIERCKESKEFKDRLHISKPCTTIEKRKTIREPMDNDSLMFRISDKSIKNSPFSCLCDIMKQDHGFKGSCVKAIGLDSRLATEVSDSIQRAYLDYRFEPKQKHQINSAEQSSAAGLVISFSDLYKNTLLARVSYLCGDGSMSFGTTLTFYFQFDEKNEIMKVYTGEIYQ